MIASVGRLGVRGILLDMDGVLYNADQPITGAAQAIEWLRERQIPYRFVTNTSSRSRDVLAEKLARFGIVAEPAEILTPSVAATAWLRTRPKGRVALFMRPAAAAEFEGLPLLPDNVETGADYVVIGDLGQAWDFRTLNRAFRLLHHNPDATLIALGMTRYWQTPEGVCLDVAPFVVALEHAANRKALVFGKPSAAFFQSATQELKLDAKEVLMLGDDIEGDVAGAQRAGLRGALVKTGKFRSSDLSGSIQPDAVLDSIAAVPAWWVGA